MFVIVKEDHAYGQPSFRSANEWEEVFMVYYTVLPAAKQRYVIGMFPEEYMAKRFAERYQGLSKQFNETKYSYGVIKTRMHAPQVEVLEGHDFVVSPEGQSDA